MFLCRNHLPCILPRRSALVLFPLLLYTPSPSSIVASIPRERVRQREQLGQWHVYLREQIRDDCVRPPVHSWAASWSPPSFSLINVLLRSDRFSFIFFFFSSVCLFILFSWFGWVRLFVLLGWLLYCVVTQLNRLELPRRWRGRGKVHC